MFCFPIAPVTLHVLSSHVVRAAYQPAHTGPGGAAYALVPESSVSAALGQPVKREVIRSLLSLSCGFSLNPRISASCFSGNDARGAWISMWPITCACALVVIFTCDREKDWKLTCILNLITSTLQM